MNVQNVLDQFELKLIRICYIQIRYIQFCVESDDFGYIGPVVEIVVHQFVPKTSAKKTS